MEDVAEAHKKVVDSLNDSREAAENATTAVGKYRAGNHRRWRSRGTHWSKTTEEDRKALTEASAKAAGAEAWRDAQEAIRICGRRVRAREDHARGSDFQD